MMEGVKTILLGDFAELKNGINFEKNQKGEIGISTIDVKNMFTANCFVNTSNLYKVNKTIERDYYLKKGDLLFVRSSLKEEGVGWTSLYNDDAINITFCGFIIRARIMEKYKAQISSRFLTYFFRSNILRKELIAGSGRVAITNINQGLLKSIQIPLLPLAEQLKIAHVLDTVQQAIEKQEQLILY